MSDPFGRPPLPTRLWQAAVGLGPALPLFVIACSGPLVGATALAASTAGWLPLFEDGDFAWAIFVALGVVATAGCMLPTHATSLVAGFLFGPWLGSFLAWLVVLLASTFGFAALRAIVGERVLAAIATTRRGTAVHRALLGRGHWQAVWLIALLRLSPVMPFAATNLLLAALRVGTATFLTATVVGVTPRAVAVALLGAGLSELDWQVKGSWGWTLFGVGTTGLVLFVVGRAAREALRNQLATASGP